MIRCPGRSRLLLAQASVVASLLIAEYADRCDLLVTESAQKGQTAA